MRKIIFGVCFLAIMSLLGAREYCPLKMRPRSLKKLDEQRMKSISLMRTRWPP